VTCTGTQAQRLIGKTSGAKQLLEGCDQKQPRANIDVEKCKTNSGDFLTKLILCVANESRQIQEPERQSIHRLRDRASIPLCVVTPSSSPCSA
jgi:hypothetical protein